MTADTEFQRLVEIMSRLRKECPWDRKQTSQSLRQYILEEAYETVEAIDEENWDELKKELGDLLLQIVFQAEIASEKKQFELEEVIAHINEKLIRRHPHVFGDVQVQSADEVKENWEQIKLQQENRTSILEGVPKNLSSLLRAQRLQDKASQVGFDWDHPGEVMEKLQEELDELKTALNENSREEIENEIGDLIFSIVNLSRFFGISAEDSVRKTINKFICRFQYIEQQLKKTNKSIGQATLAEMDRLWEESKNSTQKGI